MAKPENDDVSPEKQTWGTWEELLLACAVHRHGTESWPSVSAEIQKRTRNLSSLTASACRHKYSDLKRRFTQEMTSPESEISSVPWLEKLRRIRVDELRREVERYDLSISSLRSKVKRLEEETSSHLDKKELRRESDRDGGELVPISPDPVDISSEMAGAVDGGGEAKLTEDDSCRGSCEKESGVNSERRIRLTESMAESEGGVNRGEEEGKETSDVQSSASLPRKGTSEVDNEDRSQPSISFVEMLLSHPCGYLFSRRLETQETPEYGKIIRQHVDFEMIRKLDEEGLYKSSMTKLFRDLLLLINNAKVFYHKGSSEFNSAEQLHQLVKKQMATTLQRELPPPKEKSLELVSFKEAVAVTSKPRISLPIVACGKRSSLASKPLLMISPSGGDKKGKKTDQVVDDEKLVLLKDEETSGKDDESLVLRKMVRGKTSTAKKVVTRNVKNSGSSLNEVKTTDEEKKGNQSGSSKRKSVANFLKRMKGGGSSSDTVVETLMPSSEQKKNNIRKADAKKRATGENKTNEKASPVKKKNNGRALKGEAAPSSSSPVVAKRSRESGEKKEASSSSPSSTRSKKRARRLSCPNSYPHMHFESTTTHSNSCV
uniref:Bromo domain-containing protein n=2 Tax=Brassica campestris TaxID=3711 RepID=M4DK65_BRACM